MTATLARHILLVDDDVSVSQALKNHLQDKGYRVTMADGFLEALSALRQNEKIDLMILDYGMPDGCGTELLKLMAAEKGIQLPEVIVSSGLINPTHPTWQALLNRLPPVCQTMIQGYVEKPYAFEHMDAALNKIFNERPEKMDGAPETWSGDYRLQNSSEPSEE